MSLSVGSCSSNSCFPNIQILNYCTEGTTVYFNFSITSTLHRSWLTFLLLFSSLVSLRCPCLSLLVTHPLVNKIYMYIYNLSTPSLDTLPHNNWISFSTDSIMYLSSCFLCTPACMRWWHSWWLCCPGMCMCVVGWGDHWRDTWCAWLWLQMGTFTYIITPKVTFNGIFPRALHTREKTRYLTSENVFIPSVELHTYSGDHIIVKLQPLQRKRTLHDADIYRVLLLHGVKQYFQ